MTKRYFKTIKTELEVQNAVNKNVKLSKNFTIGELLRSQTASRMSIPNTPGVTEFRNLAILTEKVLQPLRDLFDCPIFISSGYRSPRLNLAVGGSNESQHMDGQAADMQFPDDMDMLKICEDIIESGIEFDQLILEFHYTTSSASGWIHISYDPDKDVQRGEVLTIDKYGTRAGLQPRKS